MTTQFLSRVERGSPAPNYSEGGPGSYVPQSSLNKGLPGFAPFSSSTSKFIQICNFWFNVLIERAMQSDIEESPAPGSYDISQSMLLVSLCIF